MQFTVRVQPTLDMREAFSQFRFALQTSFDLANRHGHTGVMAELKGLSYG